MPRRTRTRIRRRTPRPATPPRRLFEGLLSLVVLGVAFEWTQGSEPGPWYASQAEDSVSSERWAFGIRPAGEPMFRSDAWHLPLDSGSSDPVNVCSTAVAELWAGTAADPTAARAEGEAVCALPLPGRWTTVPNRTDVVPAGDALANAAPTSRQPARILPASRTSPHSATAALAGSGPADWHVGLCRPTDLIAAIDEDNP